MGEILLMWQNTGVLAELSRHKLVFVETQGVAETSNALASYRRACDIGRGAIFISIARGKIAEGIDFDRHYGRAVVCFGVPFLPPDDRGLQERIRWMESCLGIGDAEFRTFDAMRQAAQCIGRVLRNKADYGMMILVDRRFAMNDKRRKLPQWIQQHIKENANLSTDAAVAVAHRFFLEMAQPWDRARDLGSTLFDAAALAAKGHATPTPYVPQQRLQEAAPTAHGDGAARSGDAAAADDDDDDDGSGAQQLAGLRPVQESSASGSHGLGSRRPKRSR
jgi:DNA excision repair protein ERCC-2